MKFIQQFLNHKDGKFIWDGNFVKGSIVDTHTPRLIFFSHQNHGDGIGAPAMSNKAFGEQLSNLLFNFLFLNIGIPIGAHIDRTLVWE